MTKKLEAAIDKALAELMEGEKDQRQVLRDFAAAAAGPGPDGVTERVVESAKCPSCGDPDAICVKCMVGEQTLEMAKMAWPLVLPKIMGGIQSWWTRRQARLEAEAREAARQEQLARQQAHQPRFRRAPPPPAGHQRF